MRAEDPRALVCYVCGVVQPFASGTTPDPTPAIRAALAVAEELGGVWRRWKGFRAVPPLQ